MLVYHKEKYKGTSHVKRTQELVSTGQPKLVSTGKYGKIWVAIRILNCYASITFTLKKETSQKIN